MRTRSRFLLVLAAFAGLFAAQAAEREKVVGANWSQAKKFTKDFVDQHVSETGFVPKYLGKTDVFDRAKLLAQLSEQAQKPLDAVTFALANATVTEDGTKQRFVFETTRYEYDLTANAIK